MDTQTELFDLASDIGESRDLSSARPEVLKELQRAFDKWNAQMAEPLWTGQAGARKTTRPNKKRS
jgi:hypothetical protein